VRSLPSARSDRPRADTARARSADLVDRSSALVVASVAAMSVLLLIHVVTLSGLRAAAPTEQLGGALAAEQAVQDLLATTLVDAVAAELGGGSPLLQALLQLLRPSVDRFAREVIASPAGQAAISTALTDVLRQATLPGPLVIDLRAPLAAAADSAPPPLDELLRTLRRADGIGRIVLRDGDTPDAGTPAPQTDYRPTIAGVDHRPVIALSALLMSGLLVLAALGRPSRALGLRTLGRTLIVAAAPAGLVLWLLPRAVIGRLVSALDATTVAGLEPVLDLVLQGLEALLGPGRWLAVGLATAGVVATAIARTALRTVEVPIPPAPGDAADVPGVGSTDVTSDGGEG